MEGWVGHLHYYVAQMVAGQGANWAQIYNLVGLLLITV